MSKRRYGKRKEDVFDAICRLGEAYNTPPTQRQIADDLNLPPQYVSILMMQLELEGRIMWLSRYTYTVIQSDWQPPPFSD